LGPLCDLRGYGVDASFLSLIRLWRGDKFVGDFGSGASQFNSDRSVGFIVT
jgi:hypothetical protein